VASTSGARGLSAAALFGESWSDGVGDRVNTASPRPGVGPSAGLSLGRRSVPGDTAAGERELGGEKADCGVAA
jgi:hypothetical protein